MTSFVKVSNNFNYSNKMSLILVTTVFKTLRIKFCINFRDDVGISHVLIGLVGGNPSGCGDIKDHPDYFTFIGHSEASILY